LQRGAREWRLDVARVDHARQLHVDRPLERAVDLGRDVVALRRLPDVFQVLNRLELRLTCGRVDVVAGERDVEPPAANQLP
jgi:hypothetical protein